MTTSNDDSAVRPEMSPEAGRKLFQQVHDLWLGPELERRQAAGALPEQFTIHLAQVVWNLGHPPIVRFNDELRGRMLVRTTGPCEVGAPVHVGHLGSLEAVELAADEQNAAHITLVKLAKGWAIHFSARYNAQRVRETITAAIEFLETADHALERGRYRAFLENLFSAAELIAKAWLLRLPDPRFVESGNHGFISSEISRDRKRGNVAPEFAKVLHRLNDLRGPARHLKKPLQVEGDELTAMMSVVRAKLERVQRLMPTRPDVDAAINEDEQSRSQE